MCVCVSSLVCVCVSVSSSNSLWECVQPYSNGNERQALTTQYPARSFDVPIQLLSVTPDRQILLFFLTKTREASFIVYNLEISSGGQKYTSATILGHGSSCGVGSGGGVGSASSGVELSLL